VSLLLVFWWT